MKYYKDVLFTDRYLIKGHVKTGSQRLSTFLCNARRRFVEMEGATLIDHDKLDRLQVERVLVSVDEILIAYEMEETGDEGLRTLGVREKAEMEIHIELNAGTPIRLSGKVRRRTMEWGAFRNHDFIVVVDPALDGFRIKHSPEYSFLKGIRYMIVNSNRAAIIY